MRELSTMRCGTEDSRTGSRWSVKNGKKRRSRLLNLFISLLASSKKGKHSFSKFVMNTTAASKSTCLKPSPNSLSNLTYLETSNQTLRHWTAQPTRPMRLRGPTSHQYFLSSITNWVKHSNKTSMKNCVLSRACRAKQCFGFKIRR